MSSELNNFDGTAQQADRARVKFILARVHCWKHVQLGNWQRLQIIHSPGPVFELSNFDGRGRQAGQEFSMGSTCSWDIDKGFKCRLTIWMCGRTLKRCEQRTVWRAKASSQISGLQWSTLALNDENAISDGCKWILGNRDQFWMIFKSNTMWSQEFSNITFIFIHTIKNYEYDQWSYS